MPAHQPPASRAYVFVSPLKLIDIANPGFLYGGGFRWSSGYAVEVGHLRLSSRKPEYRSRGSSTGHRFHLSLRRYFDMGRHSGLHPYAQLRSDYMVRRHRSVETFVMERDSTLGGDLTYQDSIGVRTNILTLNAILGLEYDLGPLTIDVSFGLGVRYKRLGHTDRIRPADQQWESLFAGTLLDNPNVPRRDRTFNVPLDLRLMYYF